MCDYMVSRCFTVLVCYTHDATCIYAHVVLLYASVCTSAFSHCLVHLSLSLSLSLGGGGGGGGGGGRNIFIVM